MINHVYFDASITADVLSRHPKGTGVQRVTLTLMEKLARKISHAESIVDLPGFGGAFKVKGVSEAVLRDAGRRTLREYLMRYQGRPVKKLFHSARLHLLSAIRPSAAAKRGVLHAQFSRDQNISFSGNDLFIKFNASEPISHDIICRLKAGRPNVMVIIHDVIPIVAPHLSGGKYWKKVFEDNIKRLAETGPLWICVSRYTERTFQAVCASLGLGDVRTAVVPLAHELLVKDQLEIIPSLPEKFVLFVGSRGKRKGMRCLASAFTRVQKEHPDVYLVLAGSGMSTVMPEGNVLYVEYPPDATLEMLYRRCLYSVYPSEFEGWGLPVGESLWYRKNVICAGNSSLPEVGGSFATYFETNNSAALASAMNYMIKAPRELPHDIRSHLRTWDDVADDVYRVAWRWGIPANRMAAEPARHTQPEQKDTSWTARKGGNMLTAQ